MTNPIEIGIIGGTGGIGGWFAGFFQRQGFTVHVSGRKTGLTAPAMAEQCAVVIVAVPIGATCGVIRDVGPHLKKESLFLDLTSLKAEPVRCMLESSISEVIGAHPLFGPDVPSLSGQNVILCPARSGKWLPWLRGVLTKDGARISETTPEKHDKMMAVVQGLTHLNTATMGLALRETGISREELEKFSTPVFRTKLALIDRIIHNNPRLYAEIITANPHSPEIFALYEKVLSQLKPPVDAGDADALEVLLKEFKVSKH